MFQRFTQAHWGLIVGWNSGVIGFGSYDEARGFCDRRRKRKLGNNTYLLDFGDEIAIKLHATRIVVFRQGSVTLNSGGWQTYVTKERMNRYLPSGVWVGDEWKGPRASLWQACGVWYLSVAGEWGPHATSEVYHYSDGITLHDGGRVTLEGPHGPLAPPCDPAADEREYKRNRARAARRMRADGYRWNGYRWVGGDERERARARAEHACARARANAEAICADAPRYEHAPRVLEPERTREEIFAERQQRIDSVLAECNPALPVLGVDYTPK